MSRSIRGATRFGRPRAGVAEFRGQPHRYQCVVDALHGDDSDVYLLTPLDAERFAAEVGLWQIFQRWCRALDAGQAEHSADAVLPDDRAEHARLTALVQRRGRSNRRTDVLGARAEFHQEPDPTDAHLPGLWRVRWLPLALT